MTKRFIGFRLEQDILDKIHEEARQNRFTLSLQIREILYDYFKPKIETKTKDRLTPANTTFHLY